MRQLMLVLTVIIAQLALYGFGAVPQVSGGAVELLDRSGRATSRITDGDSIQIRARLTQAVSTPQTLTFKLDDSDSVIGACAVASGSSCTTDLARSLGWHWDRGGASRQARTIQAFDGQARLVAQSGPVTVLPRPVVLVHGFVSSWETWKLYLSPSGYLASLGLHGYAVGDGQVPGTMNTGTIINPTGRTNSIAENAAIVGQYIAAVKRATGAQMVDLVVHSMGGMISRYYIDRIMGDRDVAQLVMLGSPMGGTDCSVLPAALGFYLPASLEIRQSYMQGVFNRQITHRRGVEFYDLGGTAISSAFQSPCAAVPNDLAVPFESINAIPLQSSKFDVLHTELTTSPAVFHTFVKPLLQRPAGSFAEAPDPSPEAAASSNLQFTRVYTGHVRAGGSQELTVSIEPGVTVASFALYDATRSVDVSVRGASGNVIGLDPQANGFVRVDDPSSLFYLGYGFSKPKPGLWKVSVLATGKTPPSGADFAVSVYFVGGAQLNARSDALIPKPGQSVRFSASLSLNGQPLEITEAQAIIRGPDGRSQILVLKPGTPATGEWTAPAAGTFGVDLSVSGRLPDGTPVERTAFLAEEVQPNPSQLRVSLNLAVLLLALLLVVFLLIFLGVRLLARVLLRHRS